MHWSLWIIVAVVLFAMDTVHLHVVGFKGFLVVLLALAAFMIGVVILTSKPGDAITRDPFDEA